ncbi:hypothetical protein SAMN04489712_14510 [Thermomonospora echinospora]|uniref:Uncharacterized protein n=1 Tax=Thermomonospora echinospora TaxID=1992 RepID=A0A1H6E947_9ACTN|nr:hypothetical protein [Thermomonospora echinospora]SEG94280.1 hypothetical protein SAMN04489712_14510 [Thermomonospora echinospora]
MTRPQTRARLEDALSRLLAGQPIRTDGQLTVTNLCREAGVGRDSFYRSPDIVARFEAAKANAQAHKPELLQLREEIAELKRERRKLKSDHARTVRELEKTIRVYANQIQVLALRAAELEGKNTRLRRQLAEDAGVTAIGLASPELSEAPGT